MAGPVDSIASVPFGAACWWPGARPLHGLPRAKTGAVLLVWLLVGPQPGPGGVEALRTQLVDLRTSDRWTFLAADIGLLPDSSLSLDLVNEAPANDTFVLLLTREQWTEWMRHPLMVFDLPVDGPARSVGYLVSSWREVLLDRVRATTRFGAVRDRYIVGVLNGGGKELRLSGWLNLTGPGLEELPLQQLRLPAVLFGSFFLFLISTAFFAVAWGFRALHGAWSWAGPSAPLRPWPFQGLQLGIARRLRLRPLSLSLGFSRSLSPAAAAAAPRRRCTEIHALMLLVFGLKAAALLLRWRDVRGTQRSGLVGPPPKVWQLVDKVQTIAELLLLMLASLGWKLLRPRLTFTEIRFLVCVCCASLYLGMHELTCTTQATCSGYQLSRYVLHSLCFLVVIVALNFHLQLLLHHLADSPATAECGRIYSKRRAFRRLHGVLVVFILAPSVELLLKLTLLPWPVAWLMDLLQSLRCWGVYVGLCTAFSVLPRPSPLRVFTTIAAAPTAPRSSDEEEEGELGEEEEGDEDDGEEEEDGGVEDEEMGSRP